MDDFMVVLQGLSVVVKDYKFTREEKVGGL